MTYILSIETSTKVSSVALHVNGELVVEKESHIEQSHAESITDAIEFVLNKADIKIVQLSAVAISKGPGSYTGLRIGVSIAKGICYAGNIELIGIDTLRAMALEVHTLYNTDAFLCPMIDARRMEVYCQIFDQELNEKTAVDAKIIDDQSFSNWATDREVMYFGDGASKCQETLNHANFKFVDNIYPKARYIGKIAVEKFFEKKFENLAYFEPYYLKEFIAKKPSGKNLV